MQPYPQTKQHEVEERRHIVAEMYCKGYTQAEIAVRIGRTTKTVGRDLEAVRCAWLESSVRDFDQARADELAKIDRVENEAWRAWDRSQKDREKRIAGTVDGKESTRLEREGQSGNPSFLELVRKCVEQRCKLLGLDAPQRTEISGPGGGPIRVGPEALTDDELAQIAERGKCIPEPSRIGVAPPPTGSNGTPSV